MPELIGRFAPDWVSPPGDTIADLLDEWGWTPAEFAQHADYTTKRVSWLINGDVPITAETACRLARVLGSSMQFWLTRETQYREALVRQKAFGHGAPTGKLPTLRTRNGRGVERWRTPIMREKHAVVLPQIVRHHAARCCSRATDAPWLQ